MPIHVDLVVPHGRLADFARLAARRAAVHPDAVREARVERRALDARGKRLRWNLRVALWLRSEEPPPPETPAPPVLPRARAGVEPVAIVGSGPAGLFAALELAAAAVPVILLERGKDVQARRHDLARITRGIAIDPDSNYCFGEGGAGTYSDGKLYTRSGSRREVDLVLQLLFAHGAPRDILVDARPHIGSNRLPGVVAAIRETLLAAGVEVRFGARVVDLLRDAKGGLAGLRVTSGGLECEVAARRVILATGHGARDVYRMLARQGVALAPKPFAMGVRIEHPQSGIDHIQYGLDRRPLDLPPAAYTVTAEADGRGVYSFCMCPGGWIVPSMTEPGALVLNGMSLSRRDSPFANSGMVVGVEPGDLVGRAGEEWGVGGLGLAVPGDVSSAGPLHGMEVQRRVEEGAWDAGAGGHRAPAQRLVDLLEGRASHELPATSYHPGLTPVALAGVLPPGLHTRLLRGLQTICRKMPGYLHPEAVLAAVESRTSSPLRILRDPETLQSPTCPGLYPSGEGAGYAGGIVSAAIDGRRVARAVLARVSS